MASGSTITSGQQQQAIQVAQDYIKATKRWTEKDYQLQVVGAEACSADSIVVLDAIHRDDLDLQGRGSLKSLQLHVDLKNRKVLKELAYQ